MTDRLFGHKIENIDRAFDAQCTAFAHLGVNELSDIYSNWTFSASKNHVDSLNRAFSIRMLNWLHTRIQELLM